MTTCEQKTYLNPIKLDRRHDQKPGKKPKSGKSVLDGNSKGKTSAGIVVEYLARSEEDLVLILFVNINEG